MSDSSTRTLILLDVDGVLVHPVGYKDALTATVNYCAAAMGFPAFGPDANEIAVFEACGITNEWDSGAMCVSLLLRAALHNRPHLRRNTLPETIAAIQAENPTISRPDFVSAAREIETAIKRQLAAPADNHRSTEKHMMPSRVYLDLLDGQLDRAERALLTDLLGDVYNLTTLTTRLFQTYTLGSEHFTRTYGEAALFEHESYLITRDKSLLEPTMRDRLIAWHAAPDHGATVFTARPSLPPEGVTGLNSSVYSPEAELAIELVGMTDAIPLIAQGRIGWIAEQHGRTPSDYVKPSPVQALAAIGAAASKEQNAALEAAAALVEHGELREPLAMLAHGSTRIVLYEDSITGIRAVQLAVDDLRQRGFDVQFEAIGISPHAAKRATLAEHADQVVDNINQGLALVLDV